MRVGPEHAEPADDRRRPGRSRCVTTEVARRSSSSFSSPISTRVGARLDLAEQLEQDDLLLERLEHGPERAREVEQRRRG